MKLSNLHIVRSPLQLINVLEAIETLDLKNNILLILDRKHETNSNQIQEVLKVIDFSWDKIYHIKKTKKSSFLEYISLIKKIKKLNFENIFIGDVDSISNVIISNLKHQNVFLVDDGTSTLKRHEEFVEERRLSFKDKIRLLRFNLFGLRSFKQYKINFFSFFDLQQKKDEIIIKNEFKHLKKRFQLQNNYSDNVYILGQPLYNKEISEIDYIEGLKKIIAHYNGKSIIYLKHRYENITQNIQNLFDDNNVVIVINEYPIELDFLIKKQYPSYITGFFSTAIYTLSRMFPESESKAFYIDKDLFFDAQRSEVVENYYDFFVQSGIDVIKDSK